MLIVGIDPGVNGYIAMCDENKVMGSKHIGDWECYKMPTKKHDGKNYVDVHGLEKILRGRAMKVFVEQPFMMRIHAAGTLMTIGENYGRLLGMLELTETAYSTVPPSRWQTFIHNKAGVARDKKLGSKKNALVAVRALFPDESTFTADKVHDGLVDAVLLAKYGSYVLGPR